MAKQYQALDDKHTDFILRQHIFFTASATQDSRVNISPLEIAALRVVDQSTIIYLDRTGSGNETAAHLLADGRMTIMLCSFEGPPQIMRLYGRGQAINAPISVPKTNPKSVDTSNRPMVQGMALPIIAPTRAG